MVDGTDTGALVAAVDRLLADPERRRSWAATGREHAVQRWSWDAIAARFRALLQRVVAEPDR